MSARLSLPRPACGQGTGARPAAVRPASVHLSHGPHIGWKPPSAFLGAALRPSAPARGALGDRPGTLRVLCASGGKGKGGKGKGKGGRRGGRGGGGRGGKGQERSGEESYTSEPVLTGTTAMSRFASDETLLFTPVRAAAGSVRMVYAYPNVYTVGICSLGYQLVWAYYATRDDVDVVRLFTDANEALPSTPELVGFSLSWELDYANVLSQLDSLGVAMFAADRGDDEPIVFGGGAVLTANPEPYCAFFDVVLLGDGEDMLGAFTDAFIAARGGGEGRREVLRALAQVPGVYVPAFYKVQYDGTMGPIQSIVPIDDAAPPIVEKQTYRGENLATSTVVSPIMAWENIYMVEVVRSCPEMCRFCLASYLTLPFRAADLDNALIPSIERGLQFTDRLGLLGASVTQHPEFPRLIEYLCRPEMAHVRMSIASVRTNTVTLELAGMLARRGTKSLTVAVESGSPRVRQIVNKKLEQEEIMIAAANAQEGGLEKLKLYGMVGVPGEEDDDVEETIQMMKDVREAAPRLGLTLGCSTFVPKSHTPFQWYGVDRGGSKKLTRLEKAMRQLHVDFRPESYKWSVVQGLLSRGDRRITPLLLRVREYGDTLGSFKRAFKDMDGELPPLEYYVHRDFQPGSEMLPWSHIQGPLPEATLAKHASEAREHFNPGWARGKSGGGGAEGGIGGGQSKYAAKRAAKGLPPEEKGGGYGGEEEEEEEEEDLVGAMPTDVE